MERRCVGARDALLPQLKLLLDCAELEADSLRARAHLAAIQRASSKGSIELIGGPHNPIELRPNASPATTGGTDLLTHTSDVAVQLVELARELFIAFGAMIRDGRLSHHTRDVNAWIVTLGRGAVRQRDDTNKHECEWQDQFHRSQLRPLFWPFRTEFTTAL